MDPRNKPIPRILEVASPAVGAEVSIRPDTAAGWLFMSLRLRLTTSAVVATRSVTLGVTNGVREYYRSTSASAQTASAAFVYGAFPGASRGSALDSVVALDMPVHGLWLPVGHTLSTITDAIDVGDQYDEIAAYIIEFPTGPRDFLWPFPTFFSEESS